MRRGSLQLFRSQAVESLAIGGKIKTRSCGAESWRSFPTVLGVGATPVPISNTEVKPHIGDGTADFFRGRVARRWDPIWRHRARVRCRLFCCASVGAHRPFPTPWRRARNSQLEMSSASREISFKSALAGDRINSSQPRAAIFSAESAMVSASWHFMVFAMAWAEASPKTSRYWYT